MSPWLEGLDRKGAVRLFCLPHAGAGAGTYRPWVSRAGSRVAVCPVLLPGREPRWGEPPAQGMAELVEPLAAEILRSAADRPLAVFGHNMGAAIAHALSLRLHAARAEGVTTGPVALIVSGRAATHLRLRAAAARDLEKHEFLARLRALGGAPAEILEEDKLMDALLPMVRADFAVNETYRPEPGVVLDIPVHAYGGTADPLVAPDELLAWREVSTGPFSLRLLPGGHFYHLAPDTPLVDMVLADVERALAEVPGPPWVRERRPRARHGEQGASVPRLNRLRVAWGRYSSAVLVRVNSLHWTPAGDSRVRLCCRSRSCLITCSATRAPEPARSPTV